MPKIEMQLTVKTNKYADFMNGIVKIIVRENFSEQSQKELIGLVQDCFGVEKLSDSDCPECEQGRMVTSGLFCNSCGYSD